MTFGKVDLLTPYRYKLQLRHCCFDLSLLIALKLWRCSLSLKRSLTRRRNPSNEPERDASRHFLEAVVSFQALQLYLSQSYLYEVSQQFVWVCKSGPALIDSIKVIFGCFIVH